MTENFEFDTFSGVQTPPKGRGRSTPLSVSPWDKPRSLERGQTRVDFEKLKVYQFALDLIDEIFGIYKKLPKEYKYSLGNNLLRASLSIANNLAEGSGKRSKVEKGRYYRTSSDSTRECISIFNVLKRQKLIEEESYNKLRQDGREITSMIRGLLDSL